MLTQALVAEPGTSAYTPGGHSAAVAETEPARQKWPALQRPVQLLDASPDVAPKRPAGQATCVGLTEPAGQ